MSSVVMANTLIANWKKSTTTRGSYKNFRLGELTDVKHTKTRTYMHTYMHACIRTNVITYIYIYINKYISTYIRTQKNVVHSYELTNK